MEEKQSNQVIQQKKKGISRRDFFKASGITAGALGLSAMANAAPALAGEKADSAIINFAVKEVSKPPYQMYPYEGSEKLKRYDEALQAFQNKELAKQKFDGKPWFMAMEVTVIKKIRDKVPGYTLLDQALSDAVWTSYNASNFRSWEPLGVTSLDRLAQVGKWEASPEDNNRYIKKAAQVFGAGAVGIAALNENWFYAQDSQGIPIIFSTQHDKPTVTEEAKFIPKSMNRIVVMLAPMDAATTKYTPSALSGAPVGMGYSRMAEMAGKMAELIRGLGYNAIPMGNDTALSVPIAIDAGLGELGRHGFLINPELGSLLRICKVLTDMPIAPDKPIQFGAAEFCRTCMKCAKKCPSESISFDKDPSYDVKCGSNNPGMKKWYVNTWSCLKFWTENGGGCQNCQYVCPYSKPQTWIHDVVKGISSKTSVFNGTFATLDDALGYGSTLEENDPLKWWNSKR